jgi:hypothetical protein
MPGNHLFTSSIYCEYNSLLANIILDYLCAFLYIRFIRDLMLKPIGFGLVETQKWGRRMVATSYLRPRERLNLWADTAPRPLVGWLRGFAAGGTARRATNSGRGRQSSRFRPPWQAIAGIR